MKINYEAMDDLETYVPLHMRDAFRLWFEHGIEPGSFGMAVLSNDLMEAIGRADHINKHALPTIVSWLYNYAPRNAWRSYENVKNWKRKFKEADNANPEEQKG